MPVTLALLIGLSSSVHLGEVSPGLIGQALLSGASWEAQAMVDTTNKHLGAGWRASALVQRVVGPGVLLGAEVVHRDGGAWSKDTAWVRAGYARAIGASTLHLVLRGTVAGDAPQARAAQIEYRHVAGRWIVTTTQGVIAYRQPTWTCGYYMTAAIGVVV